MVKISSQQLCLLGRRLGGSSTLFGDFGKENNWLPISEIISRFEPTCFRLAQGLLRCGQTPFSSFLIWLSAGDWLFPGWVRGGGGESYPNLRCQFGGRSVLGFLYEKSSLSWLACQWERLQPRSPVELRRRPDM